MILAAGEFGVAVHHLDDGVVVASRFHVDERRVFGPDEDVVTMIIDALEAWHRKGHGTSVAVPLNDHELPVVQASLPWLQIDDDADAVLHRMKHGAAVLPRNHDFDAHAVSVDPNLRIVMDLDDHTAIHAAWDREMKETNVSQGAYVSGQVHDLGMEARLGMRAQAGPMWPPRGATSDGSAPTQGPLLTTTARVVSWTKLIAAGCPSEFAIRAPFLGGLTSMILAFDQGPSGVFLHVDGLPSQVAIDDTMALVVRRVYAQDGVLRYGRKAVSPSA